MKMQLKRIVSAVCAVALCASVVSTPVLAADGDGTSVPGTTQSESSAPEGTTEETTASEETNVENKQPADTVAEQPANDQEQPANDQEQPANDQEQPGNNVQESADNVQEQPADNEAGPAAPSNDGAATPSVMSYNSENREINVNSMIDIEGKGYWNHSWSIEEAGKEYISIEGSNDGQTVTIKGLKATPAGQTVTLTHEYGLSGEQDFKITVLPTDPAKVYFYVAIPSNTTMSSEGSDYRFMMHGGTVKDPESNIVYQKDNPILSYEDESVFGKSYIATWPTGDQEGKITLGNSNNAFGSDDVNDGSWLILDNSGSITDFSISFEVDDKTVTYQPEDSDGHYALRWTKFSYASTDTANWQYHLDAMLYKVVTVEDAFEAINPEKTVDAFALGDDGQPTDSTFDFALTCLDKDRSVNIPLTATVNASGQTTVDIDVKNPDDANQELLPGTYQIAENTPAANVWQNPSNDVIQFTVASDGTVALVQEAGNNNQIANIQQTYTVTYDDGVDDDSVTNMPSDSTKYKYNESATVQAAPKRIGFDFAGWSDGAGNTYKENDSIKITGNVTLTAQWEEQDPGTVGPAGDVNIDKTATELANNESDVTLSIGATNETVAADVVFVLDKSTSIDVKNAALNMLDELMQHMEEQNLTVKVGLVTFNKQADNEGYNMPLTTLNGESKKKLEEIFAKELESGTNIEAGIRAGMAMLDADEKVPASNKHLVLVTDGVTYLWGTPTQTMYVEFAGSDNSTNIWNSNSTAASVIDKDFFKITQQAYVDSFANPAQWLDDNITIEDVTKSYHTPYTSPETKDVYVPIDNNTGYTANDVAVYMAGKAWQDAAYKGYHLYSYASDKYNQDGQQLNTEGYYPWAFNFFSNLSTIGGYSVGFDEDNVNTEHMFDGVVNTILYAIDHGTVTDVIGEDFDLKAVDSFELTVGGVEQTATSGGDNIVNFGTASDGVYPYVVTYHPNGVNGDTREQFVWQINTPVESTAGLQLTYKVKLVNVPTKIGEHKLPTNEEATLDYTSTNGGPGSEKFPKPEVTYNVVGVTPASLTIYMGGSSGYGNIVGEDGQTLSDTVSLPEPGFYLELTEDMNKELRAVLGKEPTDIIDLSDYVTLTNGETTWNLRRYGHVDGTEADEETSAGYIEGESRFIYKIVPKDGNQGAQVRVKVTKDDETKADDKFDISETQSLCEEYDMEIYGEGVDAADLKLSINIPAADRKGDNNNTPYTATAGLAAGKPATLTVRYVTGQQEDVVTDALNDIGEAEDSSKAYVVLEDLNKEPAEDFIINQAVNGLTVQADPDSVALLFDDIVSSDDTNDEDTHFEQTLVENAVKATNQSFQNLQYQAKYLDLVDANNGNTWLTTNDKVTVYWPYPEGTNASTKFYLQHFEGIDRDNTLGDITDEVENATPDDVMVHTGDNGIYFETKSFSPYVLMWDKTTPAVDDGGKEESTPAATPKPTPAPAEEAQPVAAPVAAVIPQTGDDSQPLVWVALVVVSGAALAGLAVYRKKRSDK